jgi:hypothetical protein
MAVGVDEAGHDDRPRGVDHFGISDLGAEVGTDGGDPLILDEDVGALEVAELAIEGEDGAAADQDPALRHVTPGCSAR